MKTTRTTRRVLLYGSALLVIGAVLLIRETPAGSKIFGTRAERERLAFQAARLERKTAADVRILVIGNSHVVAGDPVPKLEALFTRDSAGETMFWDVASGAQHPDGHLQSGRTMGFVDEGGWDVVIVQGVMYSTSGTYEYPLDADVELCERILAKGDSTRLILFPEWKQRGNDGEDVRAQEACEKVLARIGRGEIAPVGFAWSRALDVQPSLTLHDADGNHSTAFGAYLTACTLYATITNRDPRGLPAPRNLDVDETTLRTLQSAAWEAVQAERARVGAGRGANGGSAE